MVSRNTADRYRWLSFINPNYYGFSASAVILLSDFESDCERDGGSELECYIYTLHLETTTFSFGGSYQSLPEIVCVYSVLENQTMSVMTPY